MLFSLVMEDKPTVHLTCWVQVASILIGLVSIPISQDLFFTSYYIFGILPLTGSTQ